MRKITIIALFILFFCFVAFSGAVIHEYGHVITILACGGEVQEVGIWPGVIVYPKLDWWWGGEDWDGRIAWYGAKLPEEPWKAGLCDLMGSGATTIVGYLVLLTVLIFRPNKWKWAALAMMVVVYSSDLPMYAIFPRLGLRAVAFIGGPEPEPLIGALAMGMPEWVFYVLVVLDVLLVGGLLLYSVLRLRGNNDKSELAVSGTARPCTKAEQHRPKFS